MAQLNVTEFAEMQIGPAGRTGQMPMQPPLASYGVANAGGNTQSAAFNAKTRFVRLHADTVCCIEFGLNPTAVAIGDFNGDARPDLASVASGEATVKLALGLGGSLFSPPVAFAIGSASQAVATGDLDGDGRIDLATANLTASSVSVLPGLGNGVFGPVKTLAVGSQPSSVVVVDIDGDARLDLVVGNAGSNDVTVLHGNAAGGFVPFRLGLGVAPSQLTIVDLDRDGHPDIAAASSSPFVSTLFSPR